jgi:hypothetical protein
MASGTRVARVCRIPGDSQSWCLLRGETKHGLGGGAKCSKPQVGDASNGVFPCAGVKYGGGSEGYCYP